MLNPIFGENDEEVTELSPEEESVLEEEVEDTETEEADESEGQESVAEQESEGPEPEGEPTPNEDKGELLLGKFKSEDDLVNSYDNLVRKLGREPQETFESVDEVVELYKEAERELGKPKPADNQPQQTAGPQDDVQALQQQLQQQQQALLQYQQYFQSLQQGQQPQQYQGQGQTQQQPQGQAPEEEQDPRELIDKFYEDPKGTLGKMVEPLVQQRLQEVNQQYAQTIQPIQNYVQQKAVEDQWEREYNEVYKSLPDFDDYRQDMVAEFQKDPSLVQYAQTQQGGMKAALRQAYDRAKVNKLQQQTTETQQAQSKQSNRIQKKAARISSGGAKRVQRKMTPEEAEINLVFGDPGKKSGIFG